MGITRGHSVEEDVSGREAHVASVLSVAHSLELIQALLQKDPDLSLTSRPLETLPSPLTRWSLALPKPSHRR